MNNASIRYMALAVMLLAAWMAVHWPPVGNYVESWRPTDTTAMKKERDKLYETIVKQAKQYEIPAQDAVIDKVWKATPGYNGLAVDIDASYQNMKKTGTFDERKLVFRQVPPRVHLDDLPPAPIYRGHPDKPMVALTVNVAWGEEYLPDMLETLKKHQVKATFFLEGQWVKKHPEMAKMIADAGHEIGNHSYSHPDMKMLSGDDIRRELKKTNEVIEAATAVQCKWFAPPSGSYRDEVVEIAAELGMKTILWSVDTIDWQKPAPSVIVKRVASNIHPGAIVLMHPTMPTAAALDELIVSIKRQGYALGSLTALFDEKRLANKQEEHGVD